MSGIEGESHAGLPHLSAVLPREEQGESKIIQNLQSSQLMSFDNKKRLDIFTRYLLKIEVRERN